VLANADGPFYEAADLNLLFQSASGG
jgi:hypothetical protein